VAQHSPVTFIAGRPTSRSLSSYPEVGKNSATRSSLWRNNEEETDGSHPFPACMKQILRPLSSKLSRALSLPPRQRERSAANSTRRRRRDDIRPWGRCRRCMSRQSPHQPTRSVHDHLSHHTTDLFAFAAIFSGVRRVLFRWSKTFPSSKSW
jgi:hypothetical protein